MKQNETKKMPKNAEQYICMICNFKCSKKSNYDMHISTRKHIIATNETNMKRVDAKPYAESCQHCGIIFNSRTTLWRHKKKCHLLVNNVVDETISSDIKHDSSIIIELIKQNQEFKQLLIEQNQTIIELSKKDTTTNTINNTQTIIKNSI